MTNSSIDIRIFPDLKALSRKAAEIFLYIANCSTDKGKDFSVAISGGSTPKTFFSLLGSDQYRERVDWKGVHVFWADERCVPPEHKDSNFRIALERFLSRVPLSEKNIHRIRGEDGPEQGAENYERDIRSFFKLADGLPVFDLIMLGVGEDGHTASVFPGSRAIDEAVRLAVPVYREKPEYDRVTLTIPVFNKALHVVFLVSGASKARIVADVLVNDKHEALCPAGRIHSMNGDVTWLLDKKAAAQLS